MSSETDTIRAMLDKRGAEYEVDDAKTVRVTRWRAYGDWVSFIEYDNGDTKFCIDARRLTPEQAIAATLGPGTCHNEAAPNCRDYWFCCSECEFVAHTNKTAINYCPNCGAKVVDE